MKTIEGSLNAHGKRFAIVASRFNELIVTALIDGATGTLKQLGAREDDVRVVRVPGAFEIPAVARKIASSGKVDAVICLGAVIRGATPHFDYVAAEASRGISRVALDGPVPVIYGLLTTDSIEQALERAGTKAGNKGSDAATAAVEMANLYEALDEKE